MTAEELCELIGNCLAEQWASDDGIIYYSEELLVYYGGQRYRVTVEEIGE